MTAILLLFLAISPIAFQDAKPPVTAPAKESYDAMVQRVRGGDLSVDFYQLRLAYFEADQCDFDKDAEAAMFAALTHKEFAKAAELSDKILAKNFVEMDAHYVALMANRELGRKELELFHQNVLTGLVKSFVVRGKGESKETAIPVVDVHEEYEYLRFARLFPGQQSLINDKGHSYDKLVASDPKAKSDVTIYFDIDLPQNKMAKLFSDGDKKSKKKKK
jgi:hypothetical protein